MRAKTRRSKEILSRRRPRLAPRLQSAAFLNNAMTTFSLNSISRLLKLFPGDTFRNRRGPFGRLTTRAAAKEKNRRQTTPKSKRRKNRRSGKMDEADIWYKVRLDRFGFARTPPVGFFHGRRVELFLTTLFSISTTTKILVAWQRLDTILERAINLCRESGDAAKVSKASVVGGLSLSTSSKRRHRPDFDGIQVMAYDKIQRRDII